MGITGKQSDEAVFKKRNGEVLYSEAGEYYSNRWPSMAMYMIPRR
jgi:hypothetical protein